VTSSGMQVEYRPQWTPDATELVFTRVGGSSNNEMLLVDVASGAERAFLSAPLPAGGQFHPTFSPNGRYVVFASKHQEVSGSWVPQIYTARADGTDVRLRSSGAHEKGEFSWVPTS
jgi:Tol biopolymer transport system component